MRRLALLLVLAACDAEPAPTVVPGETPATAPPVARDTPLRVASWNVKRLGHGDKDLDAVATVIARFDVVAIQEVMTREVVDALRQRLPDHAALLTDTPTPTQGSYREFFAFFYRRDALEPVMNTFVADPDDRFARDPYLACFARGTASDHLCLMTVHIVYGDRVAQRKAEITALDDALRWAQDGDDTSQWVVLGDCNRPVDDGDADTEPEQEWHELLDRRGLRVPVVLAGPELPTTLGKSEYANSYDHIFVSDVLAAGVVEAGRYDIVAHVCGGSFERCRDTVSDHAPVYVELGP